MNGDETTIESTFYNNSKYVWKAARAVFDEYQAMLVEKCLSCTDSLVISFDGGWQKRYGFCSSLGIPTFCSLVPLTLG